MWAKWWPGMTFRNSIKFVKGKGQIFISYGETESQKTGTWPGTCESQHICSFSGIFSLWLWHVSQSFFTHDRESTKWMICPPPNFRTFTELTWSSHILNHCSFQKSLSMWGLTTDVRLLLGGDFPFQFPVSCLSWHLKPPHPQTSCFRGWGARQWVGAPYCAY